MCSKSAPEDNEEDIPKTSNAETRQQTAVSTDF